MNDNEFLEQSRQLLDDSAEHLDAHTLSRLNQARHRALEKSHRGNRLSLLLPASATAVVTLAVVSGWLWLARAPVQQQPQVAMDDLEIISSDTELDLLENLDFITWLAEENQDAG